MRRRRRTTPESLSAAERRVLEAFYCGHLPAGRLSAAQAQARRSAQTADEPARQPLLQPAPEPAPSLQLAA